MNVSDEIKKDWQSRYGEDILLKIEAAKKKHGNVYHIPFQDGKNAFLHTPTRPIAGLAISKSARGDVLGMAEVLTMNCWVGGDIEAKTGQGYLFTIAQQSDPIIEVVAGEVKKL